jgi:DEAD/DEAH box helicase domain-containing protein
MKDKIKTILSRWRSHPNIAENVIDWRLLAPKPPELSPLPEALSPALTASLNAHGIHSLYSHQAQAYQKIADGHNIAVISGTASGKTLCYNLPVLDSLLKQPEGKALYLFPTKALSQDQMTHLHKMLAASQGSESIHAEIYDGDTPQHVRNRLRQEASIIITNPDMLHTGILPHHTAWKDFFTALRFIVIDEMHTYRGVFGSHVANVLRRLKRVSRFYGSQPQFILTSATIANPQNLAEGLIEKPVTVIDEDGSPHGERHFIIYNPPLIDKKLGIRQSTLLEGSQLAGELLDEGIQTIVFGRTRRSIELILTYLRQRGASDAPNRVRGYRSGYLPSERRAIEDGLRRGEVQGVVATSALELGIDIGGIDASVLIGYPGSIAATRQQAGRAGRKLVPSLSILVTAPNAMDQYLARHPEYFFDRSPERALIAPDNLLILLQHIRCAAFELPFQNNEGFGAIPTNRLAGFLELLAQNGELHQQGERFFWMADRYPAADISLRNASPDQITLMLKGERQQQQRIGQVDLNSAHWMVHPNAVYLHEGTSYLVEDLDLDAGTAYLRQAAIDYYTQAKQESQVQEKRVLKTDQAAGSIKTLAEILVTTRVVGYRKVRWFTHEFLGGGEVDLPPTNLNTVGYWISLTDATVEQLKDRMLWNSDPNDYGPNWDQIRKRVIQRDGSCCQVCGATGAKQPLHVHHIQPFRSFSDRETANQLQNLITLCPTCHRQAETSVRIRSGMAGFSYVLHNLAPLLIMCDGEDVGVHYDPNSTLGDGNPTVVFYDNIPGGLGLSENLYELHNDFMHQGYETVSQCECEVGCPSCVGPVGEDISGGKKETLAILKAMIGYD